MQESMYASLFPEISRLFWIIDRRRALYRMKASAASSPEETPNRLGQEKNLSHDCLKNHRFGDAQFLYEGRQPTCFRRSSALVSIGS